MDPTVEQTAERRAVFAAHWREAPGRCPRCRSAETEWLPVTKTSTGGLSCRACGGEVKMPKHDPSPEWEAEAARRPAYLDRYDRRDGIERWCAEALERKRGATEWSWSSTQVEKRPQREIADVVAFFMGISAREVKFNDPKFLARVEAHFENTGPVERELMGEFAVMLFGEEAKTIAKKLRETARAWYRRDPRRSAFGRIGKALAFSAGTLGMGSINLEIAETKTRGRAPIGFKNGLVHAKASSGNGSLGGAKGMAGIELQADVSRMIGLSGVSAEDVRLLGALHGTDRKRPTKEDRIRVTEMALRLDGEIGPPPLLNDPTYADEMAKRERIIADAMPRVAKRLQRAREALERAMRLPARNGLSKYDGQPHDPTEASLLAPAGRREQAEREAGEIVAVIGMPMPEMGRHE